MAVKNNGKGILERLAKGPVFGDGGFVFALEKRGYVKAGPWTPEATVENPEAVLQLHREFVRAGSDVCQTFTFYASDDKLNNRGNQAGAKYTCRGINDAACVLARTAANEGGGLVAGGICQTPTYLSCGDKEQVIAEFRKQLEVFSDNDVDFMIVEYFEHVEECEWAIEAVKRYMPGKAVAANMCINFEGDLHGVSAKECAVRMAKAGAEIVGINCHFDPFIAVKTMEVMKEGLKEAGLWNGPEKAPYLMCQPLGYMTPDASKQGFIDLPEFPFALEPRICTRWDMHKFARAAYEADVRFIGGCCGFEAYHIRACVEELAEESGKKPKGCEKHLPWGGGLHMHTKPWVRARANRAHWECLCPSSGRPHCSAMSKPSGWGVTQGDAELKQDFKKVDEVPVKQVVHDFAAPTRESSQPMGEPSPIMKPSPQPILA